MAVGPDARRGAAQDPDRRAVQDRHRLELRRRQRASSCGRSPPWCRTSSRASIRKGLVTVNESSVMHGRQQDLSPVPDPYRRPRLAVLAPTIRKTNVMFMPLQNLCVDYDARAPTATPRPQLPLQHDERRPCSPHGKDKVGRIDAISVETGQDAVELGDAGHELFAGAGDRRAACCSTAAWTATCAPSMRTTAGRCGRRGWPRKWSVAPRPIRSTAANTSPSPPAAATIGELAGNMTPEADTTSGGNVVYVFALPQNLPAMPNRA